MKIKKLSNQLWRFLNRNSQHFLTAGGVLGLGITVYLAVDAADKWRKKAAEYANSEDFVDCHPETGGIVKEAAVIFAKPAISAVVTVGCIVGSDVLNTKKLRASNIAYNKLSANFSEYRAAVIGALGAGANKKALEYASEKSKKEIQTEPPMEPGQYHFYDTFSRNDFVSTLADVIEAQYNLNHDFAENGYVSANDYYRYLGAPLIERGDELGWDIGELVDYWGTYWIDFWNEEHVEEDGTKWYSIHMGQIPTIDGVIDADAWIAEIERNGVNPKEVHP